MKTCKDGWSRHSELKIKLENGRTRRQGQKAEKLNCWKREVFWGMPPTYYAARHSLKTLSLLKQGWQKHTPSTQDTTGTQVTADEHLHFLKPCYILISREWAKGWKISVLWKTDLSSASHAASLTSPAGVHLGREIGPGHWRTRTVITTSWNRAVLARL